MSEEPDPDEWQIIGGYIDRYAPFIWDLHAGAKGEKAGGKTKRNAENCVFVKVPPRGIEPLF
jgi:hypothetical protein